MHKTTNAPKAAEEISEEPVTLFLDYDGTIHQSLIVYTGAFRKAYAQLVEQGAAVARDWQDEEISHWLGYPPEAMWAAFLPGAPEEIWRPASKLIGEEMIGQILRGEAKLYPEAETVLQQLKEAGYRLVFLSNCKIAYMEANRKTFQLDRFYDGFCCIEEYPVESKSDMYQMVAARYPGTHIMVGDRFHDMQVAKDHGIPFVGCQYGYCKAGELDSADICIKDIRELPVAVEQLLAK